MPDASILITTYDRHSLLISSIKSALSQTHGNIEVIVSNDNPGRTLTRDSIDINDQRLSIVNTAGQLGEIENMNFLLSLSNSSWITWLADDDLLHPYFVEVALKAIASSSSVVSAVYSGFRSFYKDSDLIDCMKLPQYESPVFLDQNQFIHNYLDKNYMPVGTMGLMKKDFLIAIGGVQRLGSGFSPYSDTLIPLKLSKYGDIAFYFTPLAYYRSHSGSISSSSKSICSYQSAQLDFIKHLRRDALLQSKLFNYRLCKLFAIHLSSTLQRFSCRDRLLLLFATLRHQQKIATSTKLPILGSITITLLFVKSLLTPLFSFKRTTA